MELIPPKQRWLIFIAATIFKEGHDEKISCLFPPPFQHGTAVSGGGICRRRHTVCMGWHGNHDVPRFLPDGCRFLPHDLSGDLRLCMDAAGISHAFYGMDDGK